MTYMGAVEIVSSTASYFFTFSYDWHETLHWTVFPVISMNQVSDGLKCVRSSFFPGPHFDAPEISPPNCLKTHARRTILNDTRTYLTYSQIWRVLSLIYNIKSNDEKWTKKQTDEYDNSRRWWEMMTEVPA